MRVGAIGLAVWACWRIMFGVDFADGGHAVAMAVRMAQGDAPLADEMNVQAFGSVLAVPFTWLWLQLVGLEGIVLASRLWYLVVAGAGGYVAYRALRTSLRPVAAAAVVAIALIPSPYNLLLVSYNTMPALGLVIATCAGFAAVRERDPRWAVACGAGVSLAAISHPAMVPAGILVAAIVAWQARDRAVIRPLVATIGGVAAVVLAWVVIVPGVSAALETYRASVDYQEPRWPPSARLENFFTEYRDTLTQPRFLPMWVLVVVATVARPVRMRALALAGIPVFAALPAFWMMGRVDLVEVGRTIGTYTTIVVVALLIPALAWVGRTRDRDLGLLVLLTLPVAVLSTPLLAMTTSASPFFGATVVPLTPLLGVLALVVFTAAGRAWQGTGAPLAVAAAGVVLLLSVQTSYTFRNGPLWAMTEFVTSGPNTGLWARPVRVGFDRSIDGTVDQWVCPGESILVHGAPAAYLYRDAPMDTNILWLTDSGAANQATVEWFERRGRQPDVAFVVSWYVRDAGGWEQFAARDPLVGYLAANYLPPEVDGSFHVLRRQPPPCDLSAQ